MPIVLVPPAFSINEPQMSGMSFNVVPRLIDPLAQYFAAVKSWPENKSLTMVHLAIDFHFSQINSIFWGKADFDRALEECLDGATAYLQINDNMGRVTILFDNTTILYRFQNRCSQPRIQYPVQVATSASQGLNSFMQEHNLKEHVDYQNIESALNFRNEHDATMLILHMTDDAVLS